MGVDIFKYAFSSFRAEERRVKKVQEERGGREKKGKMERKKKERNKQCDGSVPKSFES
jgi:hypothetical protein